MKKLLLLNGSPKKNRSTTLAVSQAFAKGVLESGEYECEEINISDLNIKYCLGCLSCWSRTAGTCVIKDDDIPMLRQKLDEADIVLLSFPLFCFGMPGEVKVMLDRCLGMLNTYRGEAVQNDGKSLHGFRYPRPDRKWVIISGCAWNDDKVFSPLTGQLDCILGDDYTAIFCPQIKAVVDQGLEKPRSVRYLKRYQDAGREFVANGGKLSEETKEKLKVTPYSPTVYTQLLNAFWDLEAEAGKKQRGEI